MGGRGTYASGNNVPYTFETVFKIEGVKVLKVILDENGKPVSNQHGLPAESHSSWAYIKVRKDETFQEMRIYDKEHYLIKEIGYHAEPKLNNGDRQENILQVHDYAVRNDFNNRTPRKITDEEYKLYKKYFKGLPDNVKR